MKPNDIYGWWTVVQLTRKDGRNAAVCICKCGFTQTNLQTNLINGKTTKCKSCSYKTRGPLLAKRIHGEHLAAKEKYSDYKTKALVRNLEWRLSYDEFLLITKENCHYCGESPSNACRVNKDWADDFIYNGIDRFDNSLGYILSNSLPCCKYCNYMKRELCYEDFMKRISNIHEKHAGIAYYTNDQLTRR